MPVVPSATAAAAAVAAVSDVSVAALLQQARSLRERLRAFDCALVSGEECAPVVAEFAALEKACAATKALAAARAASCGVYRAAGYADAGEWLARQSGTTSAAARAVLETASQLPSCPQTYDAARHGNVSLGEAAEIVRAEAARPGSESDLLHATAATGFSSMRQRARRWRQEGMDPAELHRRRQDARHVRHWRTELGNVAGSFELSPEIGIPFVTRLDAETDRVRRTARRQGRGAERYEAFAADAFARIIAGGGMRHATRTDLVAVVDLRAYRRGHAHDGEPCHIVGGGPIPVEVARELGRDAFVKAVVHDGVAIQSVRHFGRHIPAELRTALELGPLPALDGVTCSVPSCGRRYGLQWDHVDPVANDGPTSFANLDPKCWTHHVEKTERDRLAGLLDGRLEAARRARRSGHDPGRAPP